MSEFVKPEDQSFVNPALTGSGTIVPGEGYGPPLPDPTLVRGVFVDADGPRTQRAGRPEVEIPTEPTRKTTPAAAKK
jgi:hypothetical protein